MKKAVDPEAELEQQYKEYKTQFEEWKEKNISSIGSEAYNNYVSQFESWERDVEKRRKFLRDKSEREAIDARVKAEEEEEERRAQKEKEAEAAEAYRLSQQQYLAHHQAAIESEQRQVPSMYQIQPPVQNYFVSAQQVTEIKQETLRDVTTISAAAAPQAQLPHLGFPINDLWGNNKITFDSKDAAYQRWGLRAAPPHIKPVLSPAMPIPCWMLLEHLKDNKKVLAPHPSLPPPPLFTAPPPIFSAPPPTGPQSALVPPGIPPPIPPPNLSVPPPMIPPTVLGN
ncbi:unnamed protein product [Auanema sp. JU1783]|nr:unnamed protein product [Auanema sp. JU1783]